MLTHTPLLLDGNAGQRWVGPTSDERQVIQQVASGLFQQTEDQECNRTPQNSEELFGEGKGLHGLRRFRRRQP